MNEEQKALEILRQCQIPGEPKKKRSLLEVSLLTSAACAAAMYTGLTLASAYIDGYYMPNAARLFVSAFAAYGGLPLSCILDDYLQNRRNQEVDFTGERR